MSIEIKLMDLFQVILQETKSNQDFAEKVAIIFSDSESKSASKTTSPKKRNPAPFNPEIVLEEKGEEELLHALKALDVDGLKDIVSQFGMDPAKNVMRWRKKDKYIAHIFEVTQNRLKKGNVFR
ncbi:hypothetical protein [Lysinibacillus antri]|uniref:Uncharacterized protein n=1 Tax=Lysinibacillus antri TaxID=2498145 RepID=A0A3S0RVG8_9BACI|nr:hypothetical protein [Lysinibacillus antri]RUL52019.1 hypothetical protein EK386_10505 [Lysinibacillus antri]